MISGGGWGGGGGGGGEDVYTRNVTGWWMRSNDKGNEGLAPRSRVQVIAKMVGCSLT